MRIGSVLRSHQLRSEALAAQRRSEQRFRLLFDSMDAGCCVVEVIFDASNRPVDYRCLEPNPAFESRPACGTRADG